MKADNLQYGAHVPECAENNQAIDIAKRVR
jgi:hypothetical protein